jgi:hypothetical protein
LETKLQNLGEKTPSNRELEKKKLQELGVWSLTPAGGPAPKNLGVKLQLEG